MNPLRAIWTLHIVTFFFFASFGITIPVLPLYLEEFGLGPAWIGWVVGLMPLAGILLRPWGGWASDNWSRKWPMVIGLVASGLAGFFYLGALPLLVLGRLLQGAGVALFAPCSLAVTSDLAPPTRLDNIMATRNLIVGIGFMVGSALGGVLVEFIGYRGAFWTLALAQLVFLPLLLRLPETLEAPNPSRWWQGYARTLSIRPILAATLASLGFAAALTAIQAYYPLILSGAGFSAALVGIFFGFYSFVSVLFRLPAGFLIHRFGGAHIAFVGFGMSLLGMWLLWALPLPPLAFVAGVFMGGGAGLYLPANLVTVSRTAPKEIRGSAFSLFTLSWDMGGLFGPVLGGGIAAAAGYYAILPMSAMVATLTLFVYVQLLGRSVLRPARSTA